MIPSAFHCYQKSNNSAPVEPGLPQEKIGLKSINCTAATPRLIKKRRSVFILRVKIFMCISSATQCNVTFPGNLAV